MKHKRENPIIRSSNDSYKSQIMLRKEIPDIFADDSYSNLRFKGQKSVNLLTRLAKTIQGPFFQNVEDEPIPPKLRTKFDSPGDKNITNKNYNKFINRNVVGSSAQF